MILPIHCENCGAFNNCKCSSGISDSKLITQLSSSSKDFSLNEEKFDGMIDACKKVAKEEEKARQDIEEERKKDKIVQKYYLQEEKTLFERFNCDYRSLSLEFNFWRDEYSQAKNGYPEITSNLVVAGSFMLALLFTNDDIFGMSALIRRICWGGCQCFFLIFRLLVLKNFNNKWNTKWKKIVEKYDALVIEKEQNLKELEKEKESHRIGLDLLDEKESHRIGLDLEEEQQQAHPADLKPVRTDPRLLK